MRPRTFYHLSLLLPYIFLLISVAFSYGSELFRDTAPLSVLAGIFVFFSLSAVIWVPLYTWVVGVMLFWGRGKTTGEIRSLYLLSPVLLASSMAFPALLVGLPDSGPYLLWGLLRALNLDFLIQIFFQDDYLEQAFNVVLAWAFMAALCIVIGYAFVGGVLLIERAMKSHGLLWDEAVENIAHGGASEPSSVPDAEGSSHHV
ncbi:MAG TPA: hypothetical protein VGK56_20270 [Anaerolineales bacterium]